MITSWVMPAPSSTHHRRVAKPPDHAARPTLPTPCPAPRGAPQDASRQEAQEFLTTFTITVPDSVPTAAVAERKAREARRASEFAQQGHILRVWLLPDGRTLGPYQVTRSGRAGDVVREPLHAGRDHHRRLGLPRLDSNQQPYE
jgi:Muconolactone delta-isomerase